MALEHLSQCPIIAGLGNYFEHTPRCRAWAAARDAITVQVDLQVSCVDESWLADAALYPPEYRPRPRHQLPR
jgi:hypothetical protein